MKKNTLIKTVGIVIIICCVAVISYLVGRLNAPDVNTKTFYATVESINGSSFVVQGLEVNDINSRGQFTFTVEDTTALEWHNTEIQISDLQAGDTISVTYSGGVTETYPAGIENIIKIVLLDDEK